MEIVFIRNLNQIYFFFLNLFCWSVRKGQVAYEQLYFSFIVLLLYLCLTIFAFSFVLVLTAISLARFSHQGLVTCLLIPMGFFHQRRLV